MRLELVVVCVSPIRPAPPSSSLCCGAASPPAPRATSRAAFKGSGPRPTRLICPTTLRHRSDTGQTPPTPSTPVSIDTAPTLLRHAPTLLRHLRHPDTQTHQGSSVWPMACVSAAHCGAVALVLYSDPRPTDPSAASGLGSSERSRASRPVSAGLGRSRPVSSGLERSRAVSRALLSPSGGALLPWRALAALSTRAPGSHEVIPCENQGPEVVKNTQNFRAGRPSAIPNR